MAKRFECGQGLGREAGLNGDLDGRREMVGRLDEPPGRGDGTGNVKGSVDEGRNNLGEDLRLSVATHRAHDHPRLPVAKQHARQQRMEGPLARPSRFGWSGSSEK